MNRNQVNQPFPLEFLELILSEGLHCRLQLRFNPHWSSDAGFLRFDHRIDGLVEGKGDVFRGNDQFLHLRFHSRVREKCANCILVVQVADERVDPGEESSNVVFLESAAGGIR